MKRYGVRFKNHLDSNLVHLHKNLYISQGDPQYYDKVIRYLDAHSPEAHFKLGQRYQKIGNMQRALFHFNEVLRTYPSPFYSPANRAIIEIEQKIIGEETKQEAVTASGFSFSDGRMTSFMKALLIVLLLLNVLVITLYFEADSISNTISKHWPWGVGKDVTYESADIPYLMYFPYNTATDKIESTLHKKAIGLAKEQLQHSVLIYGIASTNPVTDDQAIPLTDDSLTSRAFVTAQFNPAIDRTVRIRFLDPDFQKHNPLTAIGANLVRTAIDTYIKEHGQAPASISQLLQNYPQNYLSFLPLEASTHSNSVRSTYNGDGGWVYDGSAQNPNTMFYPNINEGKSIPYEPFHILISKKEHALKLLSGSDLLLEQTVGLGKQDQTPLGEFTVYDRVIHPLGSKPDVYGDAGLGLGSIAIHGTTDERSIGADQSLGCIRLSNSEINALYAFVPKGTNVDIENEEGIDYDQGSRIAAPKQELTALIPDNHPALDENAKGIRFHWLG
jgi:tetratricopeptide (TPR) repeat protein